MEPDLEKAPEREGPARSKGPKVWVLWIFLGAVFLALAANLVAESDWISLRLTHWVEGRLSRATGGQVHLKKARLRLIPSVLFLEELSSPPFLEARRIRVEVSLWSLLTRSFFIKKVLLEDPLIRIPRTGPPFPLSPGGKKPGGSASESPQDLPVVVRSISVRNGHLIYEGSGPVSMLEISGLSGTVNPDLFMRRFDLSFTAGRSILRSRNHLFQVAHLSGKGEARPNRLDIKKLEASFPEGTIYTNGTMAIPKGGGSPSISLFARTSLPLESFEWKNPFDQTLFGRADLQFEIKGMINKPTLRGKGVLSHIRVGGAPVGNLSADFLYQEDQLSLTSLSGDLLSGKVTGEGDIAFQSARYRASLRLDQIDPLPVLSLFPPKFPLPKGLWGGEFNIAGEGNTLGSLRGRGSLRFDPRQVRHPRSYLASGPGKPPIRRVTERSSRNQRIFSATGYPRSRLGLLGKAPGAFRRRRCSMGVKRGVPEDRTGRHSAPAVKPDISWYGFLERSLFEPHAPER